MAVVEIMHKTYHWQAHSSDPRPSSGITEGSTIYFVDTGEQYIWHNGMWVKDERV